MIRYKMLGWLSNGLRSLGQFAGSGLKSLGQFGSSVAKKVGQFAPLIGSSIGGLIGGDLGNTIKNIGNNVASFANGTGASIAKGITDIGTSLQGNNNGMNSG